MTIQFRPEVPSVDEQIAALRVGDCLQLSGGYVKRVTARAYTLSIEANRARARWADTVREIADDVRVFLATGALPKAQGGPW